MIDSIELGKRLRQIRKKIGLTQNELAEVTGLRQVSISRLENGDEVYSSVLLEILLYYQPHFNLDYMFDKDFDVNSHHLLRRGPETIRQILFEELDKIKQLL